MEKTRNEYHLRERFYENSLPVYFTVVGRGTGFSEPLLLYELVLIIELDSFDRFLPLCLFLRFLELQISWR